MGGGFFKIQNQFCEIIDAAKRVALLSATFLGFVSIAVAASPSCIGFSDDPENQWEHRWTIYGQTEYQWRRENGQAILVADSSDAASAIVRSGEFKLSPDASLSWHWNVQVPLLNIDETQQAGHDFAARVSVVHRRGFANLDSKIINYVWTADKPTGFTWYSPFDNNIINISVANNKTGVEQWHSQTIDPVADFKRYWNLDVDAIHAVSLMTDSDDSASRSAAHYKDIQFCGVVEQNE